MRYIFLGLLSLMIVSCGTKVPYTNKIRDEFGLESTQQIKKVQFFTSATIIMEKNKESGNQTTDDDGALVTSSNKEQERVIIPIGTQGRFEGYGPNNELIIRFELGAGKTIYFATRAGTSSGKFYLVADWKNSNSGGVIKYGNEAYVVTNSSGTAYLQVIKKKLDKTKRKDRVVKGLKID